VMSILLVLFLVTCYSQSTPFSGSVWEAHTNDFKFGSLGTIITNNTTPGQYPSDLELAELFLEDMNLSFDTVADDMPYQFLGQRRPKLIHSVGVIAEAVWTPVENNMGYTGIFKSGCNDLFVRLSLAKAPVNEAGGYAPGFSLKCLRSGVKSANMFGMFSLQGQDSWNFFKNDLTNHVPDLSDNANFLLRELRATFAKASQWPVMIGLSDLAHYDQNGNNITSPVFPFRLVFHPTTALHNKFPDAASANPFEVLENGLQQPGDMYYIYAVVNPNDTIDKFVRIGTITTKTAATTSNFGDKYLFFDHVRMEDDLKYRPDWAGQPNLKKPTALRGAVGVWDCESSDRIKGL